jgi:hypothetical protein
MQETIKLKDEVEKWERKPQRVRIPVAAARDEKDVITWMEHVPWALTRWFEGTPITSGENKNDVLLEKVFSSGQHTTR